MHDVGCCSFVVPPPVRDNYRTTDTKALHFHERFELKLRSVLFMALTFHSDRRLTSMSAPSRRQTSGQQQTYTRKFVIDFLKGLQLGGTSLPQKLYGHGLPNSF